MKENLIQQKSYDFALKIIALYRKLCKANEFVLSKQLLRSGTSIGANVEEGQAAQSRADFVSKMSIASKEARETCYWLRLLRDSGLIGSFEEKTLGLNPKRLNFVQQLSVCICGQKKIQRPNFPTSPISISMTIA